MRDKLFAEALLDVEFSDVPGKAVFYIDNGHSFDNVLFYGNELTLFSMDLTVFCFFQVLTGDFLLSAIVTALVAKVSVIKYFNLEPLKQNNWRELSNIFAKPVNFSYQT